MNDRGCSAGSVFLSFLLGGIVGASLAMLLSPMSGPEARRRIYEFGEDMRDKAEDLAHEAREKVSSAVDRGKDAISGKKNIIAAAVEAGKEAYEKEKERLSREG